MTAATTDTEAPAVCEFCEKPVPDEEFPLCERCEAKYRELRDSEINDLRVEINQVIKRF